MSSCLRLRFTSANDSAGPVGLTTARRWGPSKKRFTVRSAPQTVPCCLHPGDQNSSSADTTVQRNPGASQPTSLSPQGNPQLFTCTQTALLYTTPTSHHNQPHRLCHTNETNRSFGTIIPPLQFPSLPNTETLSLWASICFKDSCKIFSVCLPPPYSIIFPFPSTPICVPQVLLALLQLSTHFF